jgi:repressor LexA
MKEGVTKIPLVDALASGNDFLEAEHVIAMIPIPTKMTKHGEKYFLVRVEDNSLNLAEVGGTKVKIFSYVLVRRTRSAEHGDVVVALYKGELTIKVYENAHGIEILRPRSTDMTFQTNVLTELCDVKGVVVAILPSNLY